MQIERKRARAGIGAALPLALMLGCGGRLPAAAPPPEQNLVQAREAEEARVNAATTAALETIEASWRSGEPTRLFAKCLVDGKHQQAEILDEELLIWNGERQARLPRTDVLELWKLVSASGFADMPSGFGRPGDARLRRGGPAPAAEDESASSGPLRVLCELEVEIGSVSKRVEQLNKGGVSEPFRQLVVAILDRCRERGDRGVPATSVRDGLSKLASGVLDPATFRLLLNERPELAQPDTGGSLLRMDGRMITLREHRRATGYGKEQVSELRNVEFRDLMRELATLGLGDLPVNLFAERYVDLTIEILGQRLSVQARQFAGFDREAFAGEQRAFDRALALVRSIP